MEFLLTGTRYLRWGGGGWGWVGRPRTLNVTDRRRGLINGLFVLFPFFGENEQSYTLFEMSH